MVVERVGFTQILARSSEIGSRLRDFLSGLAIALGSLSGSTMGSLSHSLFTRLILHYPFS